MKAPGRECKKCGKVDDGKQLFFSVFTRRDFCSTCASLTLIDLGKNEFGYKKGDNKYEIFTDDEIIYVWEKLSDERRNELSNNLKNKLASYRTPDEMQRDIEKTLRRSKESKTARVEDVPTIDRKEAEIQKSPEEKLKEFYDGLKDHLDSRLIGQEDLKRKILYVMTRFVSRTVTKDKSIDISNLLILGESGTGKTESIRATREYFSKISDLTELKGIPFIEVDSSSLAPQSYKGLSVTDAIFSTALNKVGGDTKILEEVGCVVYLDEFDKLWVTNNDQKYAVGLEILRIIEGEDFSFTVRGSMGDNTYTVNTSNFIIIASGAFTKVFNAIKKKRSKSNKISLTSSKKTISVDGDNQDDIELSNKDLMLAGVPNEVLGRFPIKSRTHTLTEQNYFDILHVKNGVLERGHKFLKSFGSDETIDEALLRSFAKQAANGALGARDLKTRVEEEIERILFESANKKEKAPDKEA